MIGYFGTEGLTGYNGPLGHGREADCALFSLIDSVFDIGWSSLLTYWEPDNPNQWHFLGHTTRMDPGAGYWINVPEDEVYSYSTACD